MPAQAATCFCSLLDVFLKRPPGHDGSGAFVPSIVQQVFSLLHEVGDEIGVQKLLVGPYPVSSAVLAELSQCPGERASADLPNPYLSVSPPVAG
jgi:hypothetical protein